MRGLLFLAAFIVRTGLTLNRTCFSNHYEAGWCCAEPSIVPCFDLAYTRSGCCHGEPASLPPLPRAFAQSLATHPDVLRIVQSSSAGPKVRRDVLLAHVAAKFGLTGDFVEIGVQAGIFAARLLDRLNELGASPRRYWLVDPWRQQDSWVDESNVPSAAQAKLLRTTTSAVEPHWSRVRIVALESNLATRLFEPATLDIVYVDARHDYCGVREDMESWWPKIRVGGIMAGDDYGAHKTPQGERWTVCGNGSRVRGSVERAVWEFAQRGLAIGAVEDVMVFGRQWLLLKRGDVWDLGV